MNDASNAPTHFRIVLAEANWNATENIVADAFIGPDNVRIEVCDGMYVEDEEKLKDAIKSGERRFQAEGYAMREAGNLPSSTPADEKTRVNAWRYLIVPVGEEEELNI